MAWKDIDLKLLPMKIVMFCWFGASACALPYMTVHMKELGLTVEETAVVYTMLPITQFLSSPIAGFIADRIGKYRNVLLLSTIMTIIFATALLYVPPVMKTNLKPVAASFTCTGHSLSNVECKNMNSYNRSTVFCHAKCNGSMRNNSWDISSEPWNLIHECITNSSVSSDSFLEPVCKSIGEEIIDERCDMTCHSQRPSEEQLSNVTSSSRQLTFYLYAVLRIMYNIFSAIGFTLVNASALALTETEAKMGEYGRQRFWAILSMAIFSPLAGVLVDVMSSGNFKNYSPAYYSHNILALFTCIAIWYLDIEMDDAPSSYKETFKNFWTIIKNPSIFFLLVVVFWLGTIWGFLESFLFWLMQEMDSPTYILGLTVTVGSAVGLPFLYYARIIVTRIGYANILSFALFIYMIRLVGVSFLQNPWWVMPFECLEIFTYHLMWVAAATYAAHLSPTGLLATIQGFIEGVHYGVGLGFGSLLGGSLMSAYGSRKAFRIMGIASGGVAVLYALLHFVWLRNLTVHTRSRKASVKSFNSRKLSVLHSTVGLGSLNDVTPNHPVNGRDSSLSYGINETITISVVQIPRNQETPQ